MPETATVSERSRAIAKYVIENGTNPFVNPDGSLSEGCSEGVRYLFFVIDTNLPDNREATVTFVNADNAGIEALSAYASLEVEVRTGSGGVRGFMTQEYGITGQWNRFRQVQLQGGNVTFSAALVTGEMKEQLQKRYDELIRQVYTSLCGK